MRCLPRSKNEGGHRATPNGCEGPTRPNNRDSGRAPSKPPLAALSLTDAEERLVLDWDAPLRHATFYKAIYRPAVLRANRLTPSAKLSPSQSFHSLRHTYASLCVAAGIKPIDIAELMGPPRRQDDVDYLRPPDQYRRPRRRAGCARRDGYSSGDAELRRQRDIATRIGRADATGVGSQRNLPWTCLYTHYGWIRLSQSGMRSLSQGGLRDRRRDQHWRCRPCRRQHVCGRHASRGISGTPRARAGCMAPV